MRAGRTGRGWRRREARGLAALAVVGLLGATFGCDSDVGEVPSDALDEQLVATVEERRLQEVEVVQGEFTGEFTRSVDLPGGTAVTAVHVDPGDQVEPGTPMAEINGIPVVAFEADILPWRDLEIGNEGPDVDAIKQGLGTSGGAWQVDDVEAFLALLDDHDVGYGALGELATALDGEQAPSAVLPQSAYTFVPELPAEVTQAQPVGASGGTDGEQAIVLSSVETVFRGFAAASTSIEVGDTAMVAGDASEVSSVGAIDEDGRVPVTIEVASGDESPGRGSATAEVIVVETETVLAVPAAAIWSDGQGKDYLTPADGSPNDRIEVTVGRSIGGWVELVDPDGVTAGALVQTGSWIRP